MTLADSMSQISNVFRSILPLVAFSLLAACKPIAEVKEAVFHGSLKGVEACMSANDTVLLKQEHVRLICIKDHQEKMQQTHKIQGKARADETGIEAIIENESDDVIVTEITFEVYLYGDKGSKETVVASANTWIAPNSTEEVSASFDDEAELDHSAPWCDHDMPEVDLKNCRLWDIVAARTVDF
jgi:hypothetical protein